MRVMPPRSGRKTPPTEAEQLRELIRESHEILQELKAQEKQARELVQELVRGVVAEEVSTAITAAVAEIKVKTDEAKDAIKGDLEALAGAFLQAWKVASIEDMTIAQKVIALILEACEREGITDIKAIVSLDHLDIVPTFKNTDFVRDIELPPGKKPA